jgi:hypothetical protein
MARWRYPLDPECPAVKTYSETLYDDPMTAAMALQPTTSWRRSNVSTGKAASDARNTGPPTWMWTMNKTKEPATVVLIACANCATVEAYSGGPVQRLVAHMLRSEEPRVKCVRCGGARVARCLSVYVDNRGTVVVE